MSWAVATSRVVDAGLSRLSIGQRSLDRPGLACSSGACKLDRAMAAIHVQPVIIHFARLHPGLVDWICRGPAPLIGPT